MVFMLEEMIKTVKRAEKECVESVDINPGKVLRPIGTVFREWNECLTTNELPHWVYWEITGYGQTFKGRRGKALLYEQHEEIKGR